MVNQNRNDETQLPSVEEALASINDECPGLIEGREPYDPEAFIREMKARRAASYREYGCVRPDIETSSYCIDLGAASELRIQCEESIHYLGDHIGHNGSIVEDETERIVDFAEIEFTATPKLRAVTLDIQAKTKPLIEIRLNGKPIMSAQYCPLGHYIVNKSHTD